MVLEWAKDCLTGDIHFKGTITMDALANLHLDLFEKKMLRQAQETAADFLLDAELVFRRYQEQTAAKEQA